MTRMIEDLKAAGWVETNIGDCQKGDEVVVWGGDGVKVQPFVESPKGADGFVQLAAVGSYSRGITALRAPRPEYAPGTVALIQWREDKPPVRALKEHGCWIPSGGMSLDDAGVEVVRVLLPAEQDTLAVEVTDEMVERAAEALCRQEFGSGWDEGPTEGEKDEFRDEARRILEVALGEWVA